MTPVFRLNYGAQLAGVLFSDLTMKPDTPKLTWISATSWSGLTLTRTPWNSWVTMRTPTPLDAILHEIVAAYRAKLYYPALVVALTLPEVCAGLALAADTNVTSVEYIAWCEDHLSTADAGLTAEDCYKLRGGVVHKGSTGGHKKAPWRGVVFTIPESRAWVHSVRVFQNSPADKPAVSLDLGTFCDAMIDAARRWYSANERDPVVVANIDNLIRLRPGGYPPEFSGYPVIA